MIIGSLQSADIRLLGEGISPIHAVIEVEVAAGSMGVKVYDLASDTGTFVNGKKVVTCDLKAGDSLIFGRQELTLQFEEVKSQVDFGAQGRALFQEGIAVAPTSVIRGADADPDPLFDFAPMVRSSTAVVVFWHGTILETLHLTDNESFTMGPSKGASVCLPSLLASGDYGLFDRQEEKTTLRLDPKMTGVLKQGREFSSVQDLIEKLNRKKAPLSVELVRGDFAKLIFGDGVQIFLHHTYAPPKLRHHGLRQRDPLFIKMMLASASFTAAAILALRQIPVQQQIEAEQLPERVVTLLYTAEKPRPRPTLAAIPAQPEPKPVVTQTPVPQKTQKIDFSKPQPQITKLPTQVKTPAETGKKQAGQSQAQEGKGARAKGVEGSRGKPTVQETATPQTAANRPSPQGGTGRGDGNSQVPDQGNVDLLKGVGAQFLNVLGNSSEKLGKGGEKVAGFGTFSTAGKGGQALTGAGKGGGGTAETLAGGLSDQGTGGGAVGTGRGAVGSGTGIIGGTARVAIRTGGPEEAIVMGAIDADAVERALLAHKDEFRLCYEREINAENPKLSGRIGTTFVIGAAGRVNQAGIESTTIKTPAIERCVLNVIKRIQFPIPRGGGVVQVSYPFKFNPLQGG